MLDDATFWRIFDGAQAMSRRIVNHVHPHYFSDCVYCECMQRIHAAGMALLEQAEAGTK